ncbi:MAG: MFS transporter [Acidobacteriota bacterium]|nr:MAG: MFS transporter [Acidobacteriota bacterium]
MPERNSQSKTNASAPSAMPVEISTARRRALTAALLLGTFLASIEVTIVAAAMPTIVDQLGGLALYPWVFSSYLLTQTISIPLYGRLADLYGRRPVYVLGVTLFLIGSTLSGLASSMTFLVVARSLQGLGAGSVLPLTMTIFGDLFEVSARTKLQGLFSLVWGISSLAGPLVGGTIALHLSWRWVFFLNLPFGIVGAATVFILLKEVRKRREHSLDLQGALTLSLGTLLLLVGLLPEDQRPVSGGLLPWMVAAFMMYGAFILLERRHPEPILPLELFRDRVHLAANLAGVLLGMVLFGFVSYLPLFVQGVKGGSPIEAGAVLIPLSAGWTTASFVAGRLVWRVGFRFLVRVGCFLVAIGSLMAYVGLSVDHSPVAFLGEIIYGLGMGACISSFTVSVQERVPIYQRGIATAMTQFSRSIGGTIGVAVLGAILTSKLGGNIPDLNLASHQGSESHLSQALLTVFFASALLAIAASLVGVALFPKVAAETVRTTTQKEEFRNESHKEA